MHIRDLPTPAVVIDLDIMERNLARMAAYCGEHRLALRPHIKTHKTLPAAKLQLSLGAIGLTVAKVGEAEVMAATGVEEILVAHPILGDEKLRRLCALAQRLRVLVAVDSLVTAQAINRFAYQAHVNIGLLVEFDAGAQRCGVAPADVATLGQSISALQHVTLRGLFTYFGNIWGDIANRSFEFNRSQTAVAQAIDSFHRHGLSTDIVSVGSTPAAHFSHLLPGVTEVRPGSYIFNDLNSVHQGVCTFEDCAVRVVTTVISTAVPGKAILDAGSKTLSSDTLSAGSRRGYGHVLEVPSTLTRLNEEHGYLIPELPSTLHVGQVLTLIPNHVCTCINLHDEVFVSRKNEVLGTWKIAARGKVR